MSQKQVPLRAWIPFSLYNTYKTIIECYIATTKIDEEPIQVDSPPYQQDQIYSARFNI